MRHDEIILFGIKHVSGAFVVDVQARRVKLGALACAYLFVREELASAVAGSLADADAFETVPVAGGQLGPNCRHADCCVVLPWRARSPPVESALDACRRFRE